MAHDEPNAETGASILAAILIGCGAVALLGSLGVFTPSKGEFGGRIPIQGPIAGDYRFEKEKR